MTKSIYKDNLKTAREIWIETEGGRLTMLLQDLGPACEIISGDDEYECEVSCLMEDILRALGVTTEDEVISIISKMFNTSDALDRFEEFLDSRSIKYTYYSC